MPRSMSAPKMPFPRTISLEPGLCSLDRNLIWKRSPDGALKHCVEYLLSTIRSGVSLDKVLCYCVVLWYRKTSGNCWVSNLPLKYRLKSQRMAFLQPFEGFLFRIAACICMICSSVRSRHPKNVAPMKDIDRFSCRTLRWNIVTHVSTISIYYIHMYYVYVLCICIYVYDICLYYIVKPCFLWYMSWWSPLFPPQAFLGDPLPRGSGSHQCFEVPLWFTSCGGDLGKSFGRWECEEVVAFVKANSSTFSTALDGTLD